MRTGNAGCLRAIHSPSVGTGVSRAAVRESARQPLPGVSGRGCASGGGFRDRLCFRRVIGIGFVVSQYSLYFGQWYGAQWPFHGPREDLATLDDGRERELLAHQGISRRLILALPSTSPRVTK